MTFFLGQLNTSHRGRRQQQARRSGNGATYPHEVNQYWDGLAVLGVNPRTLRIGRRTRERMATEANTYAESSRAERAEILAQLVREVGSTVPWTHSFNCFTSDEGALGRCDFPSYIYFTLASILFTVGALVTVFGFLNYTPVFGPRDRAMPEHVWLVGPIFVCSGLLVGCKTVLHMRRKKMLFQVLRLQNIINWEVQNERRMNRNPSVLTLPPPYDIALAMPSTNTPTTPANREAPSSTTSAGVGSRDSEEGDVEIDISSDAFLSPPSYDEALRLLAQLNKDDSDTPTTVHIRFRDSDNNAASTVGSDDVAMECMARLLPVSTVRSESSSVPVVQDGQQNKESKRDGGDDVP